MIIKVDFPPKFTITCMPIEDAKTCAENVVAKMSLPKYFQAHTMY